MRNWTKSRDFDMSGLVQWLSRSPWPVQWLSRKTKPRQQGRLLFLFWYFSDFSSNIKVFRQNTAFFSFSNKNHAESLWHFVINLFLDPKRPKLDQNSDFGHVRTWPNHDFWSNFACFGSKIWFLTKIINDSAWFLLEKLKNHVILIKNLNI